MPTLEFNLDRTLRQKRCSVGFTPTNRSRLVDLISDSEDDEEEDDEDDDDDAELEKLLKSTTEVTTRKPDSDVIDIDSDVGEDRGPQVVETEDDAESFLNDSQDDTDDLNAEDQNDYRVLVKHLGVAESIWVRLKEGDTMQRVFDETRKTTGVAVTIMIDMEGGREEVLPTHKANDLKMSIERCTVLYSYPVPEEVANSPENAEPSFKLKIVTTNRRATKEIACDCDESFAQIFQRYCEENSLSRSSVVFKFDGDVLEDNQTPQDHDMESGEQIEAHSSTCESNAEQTDNQGTRKSKRRRT